MWCIKPLCPPNRSGQFQDSRAIYIGELGHSRSGPKSLATALYIYAGRDIASPQIEFNLKTIPIAMSITPYPIFSPRGTSGEIEQGIAFQPKFDADGLIPAIVTEKTTGAVLMFAWMNAEALQLTIRSKEAHFWTRSRQRIWKKGEESGNLLDVHELRTDCDQDVVWLSVSVRGDGVACHTGAKSCFYRSIDMGGSTPVTLTRTG
jgi:phosphoribosyl-AMP cyclohydrolase